MTGELNHVNTKSKRRKKDRGRYSRQKIIDLSFIKFALMGNEEDCEESTSCRRILVANQHKHLRSGLYYQIGSTASVPFPVGMTKVGYVL